MLIKAKCVLGIKAKDGRSPIWPGSVAEVDDHEGKLMVERGVAEEISSARKIQPGNISAGKTPSENPPAIPNAQNEPSEGENDELESMSFNELKEMAKGLGIDTGKIKSKAGMIAAIEDVATGIPADGDVPPVFDAQEVIDE